MPKSRRPDSPPLSRRRAGAPQSAAGTRDEPAHDTRPVHLAPPPFSRPVEARGLPAPGVEVRIEADAAERAALAALFGAPALARLGGVYTLKPGSGGQVMVTGVARAELTRACVLTLEPFDVVVEEPVEVIFAPEPEKSAAHRALTAGRGGREEEVDLAALSSVDPPDPIVDGKVDLGALTAEFIALGLDPYPRKPGATFRSGEAETTAENPFAALGELRDGQGGEDGNGRR